MLWLLGKVAQDKMANTGEGTMECRRFFTLRGWIVAMAVLSCSAGQNDERR